MFNQEVIKVCEGITCNCFDFSKHRINRKYETRHNARIPRGTHCSAYSISIHRERGKESPPKIRQYLKLHH